MAFLLSGWLAYSPRYKADGKYGIQQTNAGAGAIGARKIVH
jgi:hypothetical protein